MRTLVTIGCVLAVLCSMGLADDVTVGKLTYSGVTIVEVKDGMLVFRTPGGRTQVKPFSEITGISLAGLDSFNEAERMLSKTADQTQANKIKKRIAAKEDEIALILAQIVDQPAAIQKLKESAKRIRAQAAAYSKSAKTLAKQVADLRKADSEAANKVAKLKAEAKKLLTRALALDRRGKKNEANQLRNQVKQIMKQAEQQDAAKYKREAAQKRNEAAKHAREVKKIQREKKNDWKKHATNQMNEYKKRMQEAEALDKQAKRIADADAARKAQIGKLSSDRGELVRQANKATSEARALETQAQNFPAFVKAQKTKAAELETEVDELKADLKRLAAGAKDDSLKLPAAIRLYKTAASQSATPVQRAIIDFRLLSALDRAGWIDESALQWMLLADRAKGSPEVLACRPSRIGARGDRRNGKAINILKAGLLKVSDPKYKTSATELLVRLMVREGRSQDVVDILKDPASPGLKVLKAAALVEGKQNAAAISIITGSISEFDAESLPEALSVRGRAILAQSAGITSKTEKQDAMLQAAMDFMRVATYFPSSESAGQSLFLAGRIMSQLPVKPNIDAATRAYKAVAANHAGTEVGKAAANELRKLKIKQ